MRTISRILGAALVLVGASATSVLAGEAVELDQVPAAVIATIEHNVGYGALEEIEQHRRGCAVSFEVEFEDTEGRDYEMLIAEDGRLLSKERD